MSSEADNNKAVIGVLAMVGVIVIVCLVGLAVFSSISKHKDNNVSDVKAPANSKSNPSSITSADMSLTGDDFAKKYAGKYIEFDGLIQGTASINGAKYPHTALLYGDDINKGSLSDTSIFTITSMSSTFGSGLEQFSSNNDTPYKTGEYPKVHIVALVDKFDSTHSWVELDPISNSDGKTPSIVLR